MTRTEARQAARKIKAAGFKFITITEEFDTGKCSVSARNRCMMNRTCETLAHVQDLITMEGAG